ncbi:alpha/beta hydrolase [Elizabethkingia sp. JS20170427COW]|uniref:alpha/beta hydrolase n=1 Tax=Elizabethkingia sp. JS20170427COW TaxID=2583851 RepID=UPI001110E2C0|nr:alpha/beta hydrolase-fold protein [Elizabethkingia sp. JS20170427COW]QCX53620.1 alpha/beta hydrolase [Elizabethkingia sp. JS20170427COW]
MGNWRSLFFILLLGGIILGKSQDKILNGEIVKLSSKLLNEERTVWVHLPKSYYNNKIKPAKYPVIYLLDANINYGYFTGVIDFFTRGPYAEMPEVIVVAIENTDRPRDFTPSKSFVINPNNPSVKLFETSGGANQFLKFINEELKPFIASHYRVSGFNVLVGHSFGGLFTLYTFLSQPQSFNAYIANDPSLWWDKHLLVNVLKENLNKNKSLGKNISLFISEANNAEEENKWDNAMTSAIQEFVKLMRSQQEVAFQSSYYPEDHHGTVSLPGNIDGLRFIFKGFRSDIKQISKNPQLLMESYQHFSKQKGAEFLPSETYLNAIIKFTKENNPTNEAYFQQLKKILYSL